VAVGSGDVHSAVFGSGAVADFAVHLYIGTSSWISGHVPFKKTAVMSNVASIPASLAGRYLIVDEHETAGACLTFLRDNLGFADDFAAMNAMVDSVEPGSGGCCSPRGSTGSARRWTTTPFGVGSTTCRSPRRGPRWSGRSTRGWPSTHGGCSGGGAVCRPQARLPGLHRRRGQLRAVVPDPRRCPGTRDPPGGRPGPGQCAGCGAHHAAGSAQGDRRADPRHGRGTTDVRPRRTNAPEYDLLFDEFVALYKHTKGIFKRLNRF